MFTFPPPERQIYVHEILVKARHSVLHDTVRAAAKTIPPAALSSEMTTYAPHPGLQLLHGSNIRDELVFAVPSVLTAAPAALGYYRLLLGVSQKLFYKTATGLNVFKSMEERGVIGPRAAPLIADLCRELNIEISALITSLSPGLTAADVEQLPLMMLGAQADGSWRTQIGEKATKGVYEVLKSVIKSQGVQYGDIGPSLSLQNKAGRTVTLALAADPDVVITETVNDQEFLKVAIEIKGGTDVSNVHNRAGEAEKSHQKAKGRGATDFWTIISKTSSQLDVLKKESPTTNQWFDVEQVLARSGADWQRLINHVLVAMGI
ncbi:XcyI family restriction endonuclease [Mycobacterium talmoniae]|uniref:XcyI family restriction endonuclease n=1 Tax=Mycobacterium talmoniae TaxID=1858794 RepID=A0A1S1N6M4_9MYCO|nr:XcyI family restriction endonuclease [Mycobacterium talmoniae]OHU96882.1 hypothetical protein BKN37_22565 [Mycobacterium talmoniae]PQM45658.1 hypothetical protein C1Y40_04189 [Mycobacterium talmoniae]